MDLTNLIKLKQELQVVTLGPFFFRESLIIHVCCDSLQTLEPTNRLHFSSESHRCYKLWAADGF